MAGLRFVSAPINLLRSSAVWCASKKSSSFFNIKKSIRLISLEMILTYHTRQNALTKSLIESLFNHNLHPSSRTGALREVIECLTT